MILFLTRLTAYVNAETRVLLIDVSYLLDMNY